MHYLIQTTLANLQDKCSEYYDEEQFDWLKEWSIVGGDKYSARYPSGSAVISGPATIGNPNEQWFEIQATDVAVLDDIAPVQSGLMKDILRGSAALRAQYQSQGRTLIRNALGNPVGPLPDFVICGTSPAGSFLGDEDVDDAQELGDLE